MLKGIDIILYEKTKTGEDAFHAPIYTETPVTVHNVLVGEPATEDIVNDLQLYGRRLAYTLALPKGDANDWHNVTVEFWGQKFRTYGDVVQGIENLIPLCWNKKVKVERSDKESTSSSQEAGRSEPAERQGPAAGMCRSCQ